MNFNIFNSLILAGILQGFVLGIVVLVSPKYRGTPVRWLGWLITAFSLNNLQYYLQDSGLITSGTLFRYLFVPYQLVSGPFLLFYGLRLLRPETSIRRKWFLTLIPFAVFLCYATFMKLAYAAGFVSPSMERTAGFSLALLEFLAIFFDIGIVCFLLLSIERQKKRPRPERQVHPALNWFRSLLRVLLVLSAIWFAVAIYSFSGGSSYAWYVIWLAMAVLIYWLGHVGVYEFGIDEERKKIRSTLTQQQAVSKTPAQRNEHIIALEKLLVDEKRFLDPDLTLDSLSEELGLSKSHLSRTINAELGSGFPDYVNTLRVAEAKSYLANPEFENYTLVAIGLEAGFASKTTFNHAFKKLTGMTPSEYKNQTQHALLTEEIA